MATPLPLILNTDAGGRRWNERRLREIFLDEGVALEVRTAPAGDLRATLEAALHAEPPVLAVAGGDGTLRAAAELCAGRPTALLPVPTGTLNTFARRLGIEEPRDAARAITSGRSDAAPIGILNDMVFLNTATLGGYAEVVRHRERLRPWLPKWPAAAVGFILTMLRLPRLEFTLETPDGTVFRRTPLLWIGIGWGSFPRVHEATERRRFPDLEIAVLRARTRLTVVRLGVLVALRMLRSGGPVRDRDIEVYHAPRFLIEAPHPVDATLDGEPRRLDPPILCAVQPNALRTLTATRQGSSTPRAGLRRGRPAG